MGNPLDGFSTAEQSCVRRYIDTLAEHLRGDLREVWLFGSAARGDMWSAMPNRSDIDLLVLAARPVPEGVQEDLVNATFPLFLECGRQIGPSSVPRTGSWNRRSATVISLPGCGRRGSSSSPPSRVSCHDSGDHR